MIRMLLWKLEGPLEEMKQKPRNKNSAKNINCAV
jgi:hypothetical protein